MAADHHIQQHQPQPSQQSQQQGQRDDSLERLFPRCRLRSPPVDTAVLIDLSDDSHVQPAVTLQPSHSLAPPPPPPSMTHPAGQSDSDASPLRRPPSLKLNLLGTGQPQQQQRRYCPSVKYRTESAELRRSKLRRPRTLDTWSLYGDVYGGGYEPSPDSEDNDSDSFPFSKSGSAVAPPSSSGSSSSLRRSAPSAVRTSASEPHIVGHWKKGGHNGGADGDVTAHRHQRRRGVKEIYDLTPTRLDLGSPSADSASGGGGSNALADPTRMEIAGGREIVSLSRGRTRASQRKQQRHSMIHPTTQMDSPHNNNNNNNSTPSSSNRSINRYSGEVYYEESMGRYGFHVGGGNTLWGSQGLEPSFSTPSNLNEKQFGAGTTLPAEADTPGEHNHHHRKHHSGLKRPLSWAGDDGTDPGQDGQQQPTSTSSPDHYDGRHTKHSSCDVQQPEQDYQSVRTLPNGQLPGIEEPACTQAKAVRGYLTDFYPEVVGAEQSGADQSSSSPLNLDNYLSEQLNQFAQQSSRKEVSEAEESSPSQLLPLSQASPPAQQQLSVATVIGGLTIAQYEGSPRRYGVRPHPAAIVNGQDENYSDDSGSRPTANGPVSVPPSRSLVPGFPRRVTSSPNPAHPQATFSPSATRQTLVDLAASSSSSSGPAAVSTPMAPTPDTNHHLASWHLDAISDRRRRSSGHHMDQGDTGSLNAETDLGETEIGHEMGKSRNFTLSPETTDYDDSELDVNGTEPSVTDMPGDPMGPRQSESFGGVGGEAGDRRGSNKSQNGLKGQFNSMPVLEDGLSSGQSSVGSGDECSGGGGVSSASVTSASDTEEDAVTDRIPLMADRQRRTKPPLSVHPLHSAVNNGCRNLAGSSPLQSSSSVTGLSGTRPSSKTTTSSHQQQQQQPSPLWVKKMSTNNSDCDHIHRHHQEPAMIQGSFRKSAACPSSDSWFLLPNMFSYCVGFPPPLRTLFFLFSWNVTHRYFSLFVSFFLSFFSLLILARTILGFPLWRRSWLTFRSSVVSRWFIFFLIFLFFFSFRWFISVHSAGFDAVVFFFSFCVLFVDAFLIRLRFFFAVGLLLCAGLVRIASPTSIFSSSLPFHRSHLSYTHTYIYYFFFAFAHGYPSFLVSFVDVICPSSSSSSSSF